MTDTQSHSLESGHPAPVRHLIKQPVLWLALAAPPVAWIAQLLTGFSVTSYLCAWVRPANPPHPDPSWLGTLLASVNLIALAIGIIGMVIALSMLRRIGTEDENSPGIMVDVRAGRTRFIATWAALTGGMFLLAIAFNTLSLFLVPICQP